MPDLDRNATIWTRIRNLQNCKFVHSSIDDYDADMATKNCQLATGHALMKTQLETATTILTHPCHMPHAPYPMPRAYIHIHIHSPYHKRSLCGQWQPNPGQTLPINCIKSGPGAKTTRNNAAGHKHAAKCL